MTGDRTLYFIHVAATCGTSIRLALQRVYDQDERTFIYEQADVDGAMSMDAYAALPRDVRERLVLVMGRFPYGLHSRSQRPHAYVTLVRDPVQRVLGLYREFRARAAIRQRARHPGWRSDPEASALSLEEFVFGQQLLSVDNGMVRAIAGRQHVRFGQCPDVLLEEAMSHVEQDFEALLVAEEMTVSMRILGAIVGQPLPEPELSGVSDHDSGLDDVEPRTVDRIRALNQLDISLHELARSRLPEAGARLAR